MTASRRRPSPVPAVLCLAAATLALVFAACAPAATPEPDRRSGPTSTQAKQPTQGTTSPAAAPDTGGPTPAIPTPAPSREAMEPAIIPSPTPFQEAKEQPEVTTAARPARRSSIPFIQVSAGFFHTCGLRADGSIICWGASGEDERLIGATGLIDPPPGSFSQISAGNLHSCALRQYGTVECWGKMPLEGDMPPEAAAMMEAMLAPPEGRFKSVSAGFLFSCGVRLDNSAECWNIMGIASDALTPPEGKYTSVSAGGFHACGIRTDQTVVCWGSDLGFDGDFLGQATPPDGPFEVINAGGYHTCGFRPDGEIRCWGSIVGSGDLQRCEPQPDGTSRCWVPERENAAYKAWGGGADSAPDGDLKAMDSSKGFSCALWGRRPHRVLGVRRHQRLAATGHLRGGHRWRGSRLRTAAGWQHRMLGRRRLWPGKPAINALHLKQTPEVQDSEWNGAHPRNGHGRDMERPSPPACRQTTKTSRPSPASRKPEHSSQDTS